MCSEWQLGAVVLPISSKALMPGGFLEFLKGSQFYGPFILPYFYRQEFIVLPSNKICASSLVLLAHVSPQPTFTNGVCCSCSILEGNSECLPRKAAHCFHGGNPLFLAHQARPAGRMVRSVGFEPQQLLLKKLCILIHTTSDQRQCAKALSHFLF